MAVYLAVARRHRFMDRTELFNGTTSDLAFGLAPLHNWLGPQTFMAYVNATGGGEGGAGILLAKVPTSATTGVRFFLSDDGAGQPRFNLGFHSTNPGAPSRAAAAISTAAYSTWGWGAATFTGGITAASITIYQGFGTQLVQAATSYPTSNDGSGSLTSPSANNMHIGNREGTDRTFDGTIAWVARWLRILPQAEMWKIQQYGPLSSPADLILCWSGGRDWSPAGQIATTRTAVTFTGAAPQNNVLLDAGYDLYPFSVTAGTAVGPLARFGRLGGGGILTGGRLVTA